MRSNANLVSNYHNGKALCTTCRVTKKGGMLSRLGTDLIVPVLEKMDPNECALHGRFVNKDAWRSLRQRTAHLGLPLPPTAGDASWQPQLQEAVRHLPFRRRLRLLTVAASSGSEANLELVWDLIRPTLFPELLYATRIHEESPFYASCHDVVKGEDAGTAAVTAGHLHLLLWLVRHGCPVDPVSTLAAAAQHWDLAGLQCVWDLLGSVSEPPPEALLPKIMTAAGRTGFNAEAKLSWLLATVGQGLRRLRRDQLLAAAGEGAAASGSLPVLGWLREQGLGRATLAMLTAALQQGHVAVADWLVDVAGCPLPQQEQHQEGEEQLRDVWQAAGRSGSVEAMRWLIGRGVPVRWAAFPAAAGSGSLEAVRFVSQYCGMGDRVFAAAAGSRSIPTAAWLLQAGCRAASEDGEVGYAYERAAEAGDAAMVLWLAREAGCPWDDGTIRKIISGWPQGARHSVELEQTVRALVEAGWPPGHGSPDPDASERTDSIGAAAFRGDLPLVRYLREELGVRLGAYALERAAAGGCEAVVEWLVGAGCEPAPYTYALATCKSDLSTLNCLRRLGVPIYARLCWEVMETDGGSLPVARWLAEQGEPVDERVVLTYLEWDRRNGICAESVAWFDARIGQD